uniref:DUF2357 domain-containing protein n=1 Tax=uncultured prokaryote TaxID=198431 RepID=H5SPY6_9ZZZZ|nr:hypothetical protein HGMM_F55D02C22 [uncultured prokaryote]
MGNEPVILYFGKLIIEFENGPHITITANAYPFRVKNGGGESKELKKEYTEEGGVVHIDEKGVEEEKWIANFNEVKKEKNSEEIKLGEVKELAHAFLQGLRERYKITRLRGIDVPLKAVGRGVSREWELDEVNSVGIVLYPKDSEKNDSWVRIFDRCAIRLTESGSYDIEVSEDGYKIGISEELKLGTQFITPFGSKKNAVNLHFGGYLFFGHIVIREDKNETNEFRIPVLVFPTKVKPEEAEKIFNELLDKREEITEISPTHVFFEPGEAIEKTPIQTLLIIREMFSHGWRGRQPLGRTLRAIASAPDKHLIKERIAVNPYEATSLDADSLFNAVMNGWINQKSPYHFKFKNVGYAFTLIEDEITRITHDTYPNRFLKYFLKFLMNTINLCEGKIKGKQKGEVEYRESWIKNLIKEVEEYNKYVMQLLNLEWMDEVTQITHLPPPSQKLLKDPFYSSAFFDYLDLIRNLRIVDEEFEKYLRNPITWMPELYELWCGLKLREMVGEKVESQHEFPALKYRNNWRSYSVTLRPDFKIANENALILLDAKYRVEFIYEIEKIIKKESESSEGEREHDEIKEEERRGTFKLADLYKMHTYREAILDGEGNRPLWVVALYPGDKVALFPEKGEKVYKNFDELGDNELNFSSGGVGVLPFKPGVLENEVYKGFIKEFLNSVSKQK